MLFACLICLIQWAHDVVRCNLLHTVDKVITYVSSTFHGDFHPFAFARSVAIVASEILARTNIGTKRTNAPMLMMHRWSITFDFWSFEETKNMDQIAWLDPQFRQHNPQVLKITNEKSNTFPFGLMFCFQAPFEFWKSERLDETKNHSWHQLEPVNRKACMNCRNSGPYMKWRSIPWKIPLQNFKNWWFLWSDLSHPSFNGLVKAPLNPPWGTLGLSSKKLEHELLGSVSPPPSFPHFSIQGELQTFQQNSSTSGRVRYHLWPKASLVG